MYVHNNLSRPCLVLLAGLFTMAVVSAQESNVQGDLDFLEEPAARQKFNAEDFTSKFELVATETSGGDIRPFSVKQAPALATLPGEGVSQALVTLKPCAINQPHSHPRGTEVAFLTQGKLKFAFIEENPTPYKAGGRVIAQELNAGQTFVIPQGLIHWALNDDCDNDAEFIASFPTRDPGTQTTLRSLFSPAVPFDVHRATTGLDDATIKTIADAIAKAANPSFDQECLKKCNKNYDYTVKTDEYPAAPAGTPVYGRRKMLA